MPAFYSRTALQQSGQRAKRRTTPRAGTPAQQAASGWIGGAVSSHGAKLWLDATDITDPDGTDLAAWPSRAGTATQASASLKPRFTATGWDGGPCVLFDGVGEALATDVDLGDTPSVAVIAVIRRDATAGDGAVFEYTVQYYNLGGVLLAVSNNRPLYGTGGTAATYRIATATVTEAKPAVIAAKFSRVPDPDTAVGWLTGADGVTAEITAFDDSANSGDGAGNYPTADSWIGSRNNGSAIPLNGAVRMLIVLGGAPQDAEMANLARGAAIMANIPWPEPEAGAGLTYNIDEVAGTTITDGPGTLYDDGGPDGNYSTNNYTVTIQAPAGQQVRLTAVSFEMGAGGGWYLERVRIFSSGPEGSRFYHGRMSEGAAAAPAPNEVTTSSVGGTLVIQQESVGMFADSGFEFTWEFV
jgi:hypothetical protein